MCGRYSLTSPTEAVRRLFDFPERPNLAVRVNIAPSQEVAAVRLEEGEDGTGRHFVSLRWGLIPSWAKEPGIGNRMINARAETVAEKPSFRSAFRHRRCLVPADGFYEWRREGEIKQPYRIGMKGGAAFAFAGLWESWDGTDDDDAVETFTILTTEANRRLGPIHARMPVILAPDAYDAWLAAESGSRDDALGLLRPFAEAPMAFYRVSTRVNSPRNDDPDCLTPIAQSDS